MSKAEEILKGIKHYKILHRGKLYPKEEVLAAMKEAVSDAFDAGTMSILRSDTNGIQYRKDQFIKDYFGE